MSCLKLCDSDDCHQTENDTDEIYGIDVKDKEFLREHCSHWFNHYCSDICNDCIDITNSDHKDFWLIDELELLSINKKYIDNPSLLK